MSLINGALQIGRSGINAAQAGLSVVGNNMSNAATIGYSRQRATLNPTSMNSIVQGKYSGTGVGISGIHSLFDDALNGRLRIAMSEMESHNMQQKAIARSEATFQSLATDINGAGIGLTSRLSRLFTRFNDVANQPDNGAARSSVLIEGRGLGNFIRERRNEIGRIQGDIDAEVRGQVVQADKVSHEIALLNSAIATSESGLAGAAGALRDQRETLLRELSELIEIRTIEVEGGSVNVFIGNEPLIQYGESRGLKYTEVQQGGSEVLVDVRFKDNNLTIQTESGKIHGLILARDEHIGNLLNEFDDFVNSMILEVNHVHAMGGAAEGFSTVRSTFGALDGTASLSDMTTTTLKWPVTNGRFSIVVTDDAGVSTTSDIDVQIGIDGTDSTLTSVTASINAINGITATVDSSGFLTIQADNSTDKFNFKGPQDASDGTNFLAVMGINTFFEGSNAVDIDVRTGLTEDYLSTSAALLVSQFTSRGVDSLSGLTFAEHFSQMMGQMGADLKGASDNLESASIVVQTLQAERDSVSGVSLDEEAIDMIIYQRLMQGSSRYISVIDDLMDEVLALV